MNGRIQDRLARLACEKRLQEGVTKGTLNGDPGIGPGPAGERILCLPDNHPYLPHLLQLDAGTRGTKAAGPETAPGEMGTGSSGAGTVLQFFTRLRRHASLDGASPYFKVKKWKLESSQRASSLDTRGKATPSDSRGHLDRGLTSGQESQGLSVGKPMTRLLSS